MSRNEKAHTIGELEQKLSALREQIRRMNDEAEEWAEKRNKLNEQIRSLRTETQELRSERDKLNMKVNELKQLRENTKKTIQEKKVEIEETDQQIRALAKRKPSRNRQILQRRIEEIEWKIQTTPLDLQEEKELVESVGRLESEVEIHNKLEILEKKMIELQTERGAAETENKLQHGRIMETAQKSQEIHKGMVEKINRVRELSARANNMHKNSLKTRLMIKPVAEEMTQILGQLKLRKQEIRKEQEKEKEKREEVMRKKVEERVREKLKRGEKLTWEEFQVLVEDEETTQD